MPNRTPKIQLFALFILCTMASAGALIWPPAARLDFPLDDSRYQVKILRDTWGVPHIFGKTDADAAYGLAYAHAEDDFLTIQQTLLAARGQLASVYGKDAAANDYMVALLRIHPVVDAGYERDLAPETRTLVEGYAAGLNRYALQHPEEVLTPDLFPLTGKDVVAASVHKLPLFYDLDKALAEVFASTRQREVSPRPGDSSSGMILTTKGTKSTKGHEGFPSVKNLGDPLCPSCTLWLEGSGVARGSNTLAVSPKRTSDGSTFLDVNSHQPWEGPVAWYEAHVHSEQGWDMAGATFPATPAIIHGHNRNLGWAFTVNYPDLSDVYVLDINPQNPNQYRFDGVWKDFEVGQARIRVRLAGRFLITVKREVLWSAYGPAMRTPHGTYAIRFAGFGRVDLFQQLYRMNKANNFQEWQAAVGERAFPNFNIGYADRDGNIYYLYNALLPVRKEGYDWSLYLPGDTSDTLWTEFLPFEQLPQVLNPPSGFIQNANSTPFQTTLGEGNPDPADFSPTLGIETRMTNRALRALEQLGSDDSITFEEFTRYKFDQAYSTGSDMATFQRMLCNPPSGAPTASPEDADLQAGLKLLCAWDLKASADSPGATVGIYTLYDMIESKQPVKGGALVGAQVSQQALLDSFTRAVRLLKTKFGRVDVPWAQVNRLVRGKVDLGLGGGPDVLNAVYGHLQEDSRLKGYQGDSYVMLVDWKPDGTLQAFSIHQYGSNTLHAGSPHYADQAPLFTQRELKPAWYDEAEIRAHLESEYRPQEK